MADRTVTYHEPVPADVATLTVADVATLTVIDALRRMAGSAGGATDPANVAHLDLADVVYEHLKADDEARSGRPVGGVSLHYDVVRGAGGFRDAVWDLCGRGILRPAAELFDDPCRAHLTGRKFAVTAYGLEWLRAGDDLRDVPLPSEYGRFGALLATEGARFGGGYDDRSREALRCYRARCYLACCALCGAAAESIFLALAVEKLSDEAKVLREYGKASGRAWLLNTLKSQQNGEVHRQLELYGDLLKYWRDTAAHGTATAIHEAEAFTSMLLLLRLALLASERWDAITKPEQIN